jgi:hypothetical protein
MAHAPTATKKRPGRLGATGTALTTAGVGTMAERTWHGSRGQRVLYELVRDFAAAH